MLVEINELLGTSTRKKSCSTSKRDRHTCLGQVSFDECNHKLATLAVKNSGCKVVTPSDHLAANVVGMVGRGLWPGIGTVRNSFYKLSSTVNATNTCYETEIIHLANTARTIGSAMPNVLKTKKNISKCCGSALDSLQRPRCRIQGYGDGMACHLGGIYIQFYEGIGDE